jgi:hypothetical protein
MSDTLEQAQEGIERAHHAHQHEGDRAARWIAVLIAVLAAALAITELGEKAEQTEYLTRHIAVSDDYAYYQEKHVRQTALQAEAGVLESLPNAADPAIQARIKSAEDEAARLQDSPRTGQGMTQVLARAQKEERGRDHAFHLSHELEWVVGALQIAIVLASVAVVTRVRWLAWAAAGLGGVMSAYGLLIWSGAI